jgi:hypothetical protein
MRWSRRISDETRVRRAVDLSTRRALSISARVDASEASRSNLAPAFCLSATSAHRLLNPRYLPEMLKRGSRQLSAKTRLMHRSKRRAETVVACAHSHYPANRLK